MRDTLLLALGFSITMSMGADGTVATNSRSSMVNRYLIGLTFFCGDRWIWDSALGGILNQVIRKKNARLFSYHLKLPADFFDDGNSSVIVRFNLVCMR